ncbi:MAG: hypothetical protein JNJ60_21430, partial [Rhodocyclaceae bacterium]|nr:hypothetical protein [Rhodocyclaceae bacterium]
RAYPANYAIGNFDHDTGEYNITPQNALGHSGGVAVFEGVVIGVLSRRMKGDPLCRAVATHLFVGWLRDLLGDDFVLPPGDSGRSSEPPGEAYRNFVEKLRVNMQRMLADAVQAGIGINWHADPLVGFDLSRPEAEITRLMDDLTTATRKAAPAWPRADHIRLSMVKRHCRELMSELCKLAVNPANTRAQSLLAGAKAVGALEIACRFGGTGDIVYCALADLTHELEKKAKRADVAARNALHVEDLLAESPGLEARQTVLRKLWARLWPGDDIPARIDDANYGLLKARMARVGRQDKRRFFLTVPKSAGVPAAGDFDPLAADLQMAIVMRVEGECADLMIDECVLIDAVLGYLELLETA